MMFFLYSFLLVLSISLTNAVQLDGDCINDAQCEGSNILCRNDKCQCNTPSYTPCESSCKLNLQSAYEGDHCEAQGNCVGNAICSGEKICRCLDNYVAKNGLCFKNLNAFCINSSECWSQYCLNAQCTCAPGYEPSDDRTGCRRKLVYVYDNWNDANTNNAFCTDSTSCIDILAECKMDPRQPTAKYCQCPDGYQVKDENKRCEPFENSLLSPLDSLALNYGPCGVCTDNNAACIQAGGQRTCWCRSGYVKNGDKCEQRIQSLIVFPNSNDLNLHNFAHDCVTKSNGTNQINNRLCTCAPYYQFVPQNQSCVKIQLNWINDVYEYGLCTRIDSRDMATGENGLCPEPLICREREDKHVCSCGKDKFIDLDDQTQCVYYIGKTTNSTVDKCPTRNARRDNTTGICECSDGYKAANGNRQCELILSSQISQSGCNANRSNNAICENLFGNKAFLCTTGECRCSGSQSFPNSANTHCYAPLNEQLVQPTETCPLNSALDRDQCKCNYGYRPSNDLRSCVRWNVQLIEYSGPSTNTNNTLITEDCQALFTGPVESIEGNRCQCKQSAFINDDSTGCWYQLNIPLSRPAESLFCPPFSSTGSGVACQCDDGYTRNNNTCVRMVTRVYSDNDPTAANITGLTDTGCRKWFGNGAMKSTNGDYCICNTNAFPVDSNSYCHFYINAQTTATKGTRTCPANTDVTDSSPTSACVCKPGYYVSDNNQTCVTRNINLIETLNTAESHPTNCINFTNNDCIVKYGEQAFCRDEKCYCDRRLSFIKAGKCESFSKYTFPGVHERASYSCNTVKDCGNKENVICGYLNDATNYKVCHCKDGLFLDPQSQTCVEQRCEQGCATSLNFECRGYECVCKEGYYQTGPVCSEIPYKLQLYQPCNYSAIWAFSNAATDNDPLYCNRSCNRVQCKPAYRPEELNCVRYELNKDRCVYNDQICQQIDENSICNRDENLCSCRPSYYPFDDQCVRAVGSECTSDEQCGLGMLCKGQRCSCNETQIIEHISDIYGRPMQRCINGIDRIRFNAILLLLFVLARVFFI